jgi:hypothetical protein
MRRFSDGTRNSSRLLGALACNVLLTISLVVLPAAPSPAFEVRGVGTDFLLGNDITDLDDVHDEAAYNPAAGNLGGFNAQFFASEEAGFGGGEFAFNVFDNEVGGGNAKWCCGTVTNAVPTFPLIVGGDFGLPYFLTHFTVTSGNDTPARQPRVWEIQGSNDSTTGLDGTWTTIFSRNDPATSVWDMENQVVRFNSGGEDFADQTASYEQFRMVTLETGATAGAFFQLNEIELFGDLAFDPGDFDRDGTVDRDDFEILRDNMSAQFAGAVSNTDGDYNVDGAIDLQDFFEFKQNFPGAVAQAQGVPEPSTAALAVCFLTAVSVTYLRRRARPAA